MTELVFDAVADGPLFAVNARFGDGSAVVLGSDAAALATLVALGSGARAPGRGGVRLDGTLLHASPELRRLTGSLLAEESLPALGSVSDAVGAILAARGEQRTAPAFLEEVGLADWRARRSRDLDASERRTLLLALALSHPSPRLLALYEPLAAARGLDRDFVASGLARATGRGAVVLSATQSLEDARSLGGVPWLLHHGALTNAPNVPLGSPSEADHAFVVETPDARRLTAALAHDPAVGGVRWNEEHARDTVLVFGRDLERLANAIVKVLSEQSLGVRSLELAPVPLEAFIAPRPRPAPGPPAYPYGALAAPPHAPNLALGAPLPVVPEAVAPAPPDQSVAMPTAFADPTRPPGGGRS